MNYSNFAARLKSQQQPKPGRTVYPPEMLAMVERLHFEDRIDAKKIAQALLQEPEWQGHTFAALHGAICRHLRRVTVINDLPPRRLPRTRKPKHP